MGGGPNLFCGGGKKIGWTFIVLALTFYLFLNGPIPVKNKYPETPAIHDTTEPAATTMLVNPKDEFSVASRGFWKGLGSTKGHLFDSSLATAISAYLKKEQASLILELGAGMGLYAKQLRADGFFASCYDGNPDTQTLSEGRCSVIDLSRPIDLCRHDWVLSLEVGEHIPKEFEQSFLTNLDKGNSFGMILSWAVEGQGGTSHVNNKNNTYVRNTLKSMGYNSDFEGEKALRDAATLGWFKSTVMVFKKREDLIQ